MYIYGIGGLIMFIWFCCVFYKVRKISETNENDIISLRSQLAEVKRRLDKFENETEAVREEYVEKKHKKENDQRQQHQQKLSDELNEKYEKHIAMVTASLGSVDRSKSDIRKAIFEPKDWVENIASTTEKRLALYMYYEKILQLFIHNKKMEEVSLAVCEEAYRLIGFLADNLKGESSEIMSYYCDVEKKTYGKSARLTAMCQKLDSIGVLDRGIPFSCRLR
jgi:vacuolar-type H+-ATPase subunit I/STV1